MTGPLRPASLSPAGPLVRGLASLLLAGAGEWVIRSGNSSGLGLGLYLLAILLFSFDGMARPKEDVAPSPARSRRPGILAVVVALGSVGLNLLALRRYDENRLDPAAVSFWLASLVAIVCAGIAAGRLGTWSPRWTDAPLPESRRGRRLFGLSLLALVALSAVTRFYALDRIPLGINADEGDRAAVSLQILRHIGDHPVFDSGWYHISNIYFRILAGVMSVVGTDYVGARVLGAASGIVGVLVVALLATRHFGWRAGLFAAGLTSTFGAVLQFSRETTEAGPTAVLWALAALFFLEGIRGGRLLAWVLAGFFGGFSIYFYPPARLWPLLAALVSIYLLVHGLGLKRVRLLPGISAAALGALLTMSPFLWGAWRTPGVFTVRARETTIFVPANRLRLGYYDPKKPVSLFFREQVERSVGLFNRYHDGNYFWPCDRPVLPPLLAALFFLGLGTSALRIRDPRFFFLTIWFWVGFSGVIVTVETPALQRMAPAILAVALFPVVVLADVIRRVRDAAVPGSTFQRRAAAAATVVAGAAVAGSMAGEARYYFVDYARIGVAYSYPTETGLAVAAEGAGTWVVALGKLWHHVNPGWVRLLAPETPRAGVVSPGMSLPLTLPPNRNLTFFVYPSQEYYLPLLRQIYPGGKEEPIVRGESGFLFTAYRISRDRWAAGRGAVARIGSSPPIHVGALGMVPSGANGTMRWSAVVRFPRFANWGLRVGPGPARLRIDGLDVLTTPAGEGSAEAVMSLPRGDHAVVVEGRAPEGVKVEWAAAPADGIIQPSAWEPIPETLQFAEESSPGGLLGVVEVPGRPPLQWLDRTLASGGLSQEVHSGEKFQAMWTGFLTPPVTGVYRMALRAQGEATIQLDGVEVLASQSPSEEPVWADLSLSARRYAVRIVIRNVQSPGILEWTWTPPGGTEEVVPPSVLTPPSEAAPGPPRPAAAYWDPALLRPNTSVVAVW